MKVKLKKSMGWTIEGMGKFDEIEARAAEEGVERCTIIRMSGIRLTWDGWRRR